MPATVDTGMEKAEMKKLLANAKKEPVNCAFAQGKDASTAILLMDKVKAPKSVEKDLKKEFPDFKNERFGTVEIDPDDDPKLVKFRINKKVTGMAKKLAKTLKGTGFSKVIILGEDGTEYESHSEAEEEEQVGQKEEEEEQEGGGTEQVVTLDAGALTAQLRELAGQVSRADPSQRPILGPLAVAAQTALKAGDLAGAEKQLAALTKALGAARVDEAQTQVMGAAGGSPVAYAKSRMAWIATRKKIETEIERLRGSILDAYKTEEYVSEIDSKFRERVRPVLETIDEELAEKLDDMVSATDLALRTRLMEEAHVIMQRYTNFVASDALVADLDNNPFAPLAIKQTVTGTLKALAAAVK